LTEINFHCFIYFYRYDENGNLVGFEDGKIGKVTLQYDKGDRIEKIIPGNSEDPIKILYDNVGGCVRQIGKEESPEKDLRRFWHDARGKMKQFMSVKNDVSFRVSFHHDHLGRLVAWSETRVDKKSSEKRFRQYFYSDFRNPMRVTHVHNPKSSMTQRLLYDHNGHLAAVETSEQKLLVATDQAGTPILVFRSDGTVLKEMKYSPFGLKVSDSNPNMEFPIGFMGGIVSSHAPTMYHMSEGRVFDAEISQWICPDWESLQDDLESPHQLFVYRFRNNDPINPNMKPSVKSNTKEWAALFGFDLDKILDVGNNENEISSPDYLIRNRPLLTSRLNLLSGLESTVRSARASLRQLNFVPSRDFSTRLVLNARIASQNSGFGDGFLLSVLRSEETQVDRGLSIATFVEGVPGVVQNIFASVLNGSQYLADISFLETADKSIYYFAKISNPDISGLTNSLSIDMDNVNRLAGQYTVELKDLVKGLTGKDLKIAKDNLELHIIYADETSLSKYRETVHDDVSNSAIWRAWAREKNLVMDGFTGYGDWTKAQRAELAAMRPGTAQPGVRGFEAVEILPRNRLPQLVRDQSNYGFVSELVQARRRKNRHGRSRKHL
jgi:hypothetical protein